MDKVSHISSNLQNSAATFDIKAFNSTLEIVRRRLKLIETAKAELKKVKEMYDDFFANEPVYQKVDQEVKEAVKKRKDVKVKLAKQPAVTQMLSQVKQLKEQIKDNQDSLSVELMEYYKTAGVTEIEDEQGNVQEFEIIIKLKPKKRTQV